MNHKIGRYDVKLKKLGWYDQEVVKNEIISGAKIDNSGLKGIDGSAMFKMKLKLWELSIEEIKEGEKVIPYSEEWVKGLTVEEGNAIDEAVNEIDAKK